MALLGPHFFLEVEGDALVSPSRHRSTVDTHTVLRVRQMQLSRLFSTLDGANEVCGMVVVGARVEIAPPPPHLQFTFWLKLSDSVNGSPPPPPNCQSLSFMVLGTTGCEAVPAPPWEGRQWGRHSTCEQRDDCPIRTLL